MAFPLGMAIDMHYHLLMLVSMTLTLMQGHSGSARARIQCWTIPTTVRQTCYNQATVLRNLDFENVYMAWPSCTFREILSLSVLSQPVNVVVFLHWFGPISPMIVSCRHCRVAPPSGSHCFLTMPVAGNATVLSLVSGCLAIRPADTTEKLKKHCFLTFVFAKKLSWKNHQA